MLLVFVIFLFKKTFRLGKACVVDKKNLQSHVQSVKVLYFCLLAAIVLIESVSRLNGGPSYDLLMWIHLSFVIPIFLILTAMIFWITGLKQPRLHSILAHLIIVLAPFALATGFYLLILL